MTRPPHTQPTVKKQTDVLVFWFSFFFLPRCQCEVSRAHFMLVKERFTQEKRGITVTVNEPTG